MSTTQVPEVVRRYAITLLEATSEQNVGDAVRDDLDGLQTTLASSDELCEFVDNRLLDPAAFTKAFEALFEGKLNGLTLNFLRLLAQRRRVHLLPAIVACAQQLLAQQAGIFTAQVRSAVALSPEQIDQLQQRLATHTGGKVQVDVEVDEGLRGGLVARIGDTVFDGTIETQLARLHRRLIGN
ncbi:MAG: ATP synthase F1 subunit delta [Gemmatimonadetes bacterium]|jgi:F-type H+-transporting ATPase subunit delta|nr:ATP synthase F1 subunit delta [Gemmatimonadota bacterium]MBT6146503.1 ATP synthase F1 subunit delta [Gemmatimonadota bacterium]